MCQWHLERLRQSVGPSRVSASGDAGAGASSAACLRYVCCAGVAAAACRASATATSSCPASASASASARRLDFWFRFRASRGSAGIETAKRPALGSHDERRLRTNAHLRNAADGVNRSVSRFLRLVSLLDFCVCYASKPSPQFLSFCGWFRISVSASVSNRNPRFNFCV